MTTCNTLQISLHAESMRRLQAVELQTKKEGQTRDELITAMHATTAKVQAVEERAREELARQIQAAQEAQTQLGQVGEGCEEGECARVWMGDCAAQMWALQQSSEA